MSATRAEAERDNVKVPTTIEEYCLKPKQKTPEVDADVLNDFYDDDYNVDEDDEEEPFENEDNEDSGNGES